MEARTRGLNIMNAAVEIHLRIRTERRADLFAFLAEAIPFYERPGGIRVRLIERDDDPNRFIEVVEYATVADYEQDQQRVEHDPEMKAYLERWRALLAEPPQVEIHRSVPLPPGEGDPS